MRTLALAKDVVSAIRDGHPWIYQRALRAGAPAVTPGELVRVALRGAPVAVGYADPGSPIAVRVLSRDPDVDIDEAWVRARVRAACEARAVEPALADATGVRLIHGEADGLPGLVVDRYDAWGVLRLDGQGAEALWRPFAPAIAEACGVRGLWDRAADRALGAEPPELIEIAEGDARFEVDVRRGQKTGFFLDQRANRRALRAYAAGADVLNLFSYTGGFSVHAALAGARRVTSVDKGEGVVAQARRNLELNALDAGAHPVVSQDVFELLERAVRDGRRWDVVVCDPPSFAPSERAKPRALRAYRSLNRQALDVVAPGGLLVSASCSSHVTDGDLLAAIAGAAADARRDVRAVAITGADVDHPVAPGFPEGRYLTCVWLRA